MWEKAFQHWTAALSEIKNSLYERMTSMERIPVTYSGAGLVCPGVESSSQPKKKKGIE